MSGGAVLGIVAGFAAGVFAMQAATGDFTPIWQRVFPDKSLEAQRARFEQLVSRERVGNAFDVWLVKDSFGAPDRVALFFGYLDDFATCYEFAQMYMQRYPSDSYSCQWANL